jgi:hypothetical protein
MSASAIQHEAKSSPGGIGASRIPIISDVRLSLFALENLSGPQPGSLPRLFNAPDGFRRFATRSIRPLAVEKQPLVASGWQ